MNTPLSVAIPWGLSHYISLNGFHPLYRALFEEAPEGIVLNAWDNVDLSQRLSGDAAFRDAILREVDQSRAWIAQQGRSDIARQYYAHYWSGNHALTRLIPGDIEFHHTAPFPSMTRPFIFHCEDFRYIFFPFSLGNLEKHIRDRAFRDFYARIFESPLCLGISSHLPGTLQEISHYFRSPLIDGKLFESGIGFFGGNAPAPSVEEKPAISEPAFLFINSANQDPRNFFRRGGHLVLRCWQALMQDSHRGRLIMRCNKPSDSDLKASGVDTDWLSRHSQSNILWIENFLGAGEIEALMRCSHFLLIPSIDLHSVSIMQAMWNGAIPVVSNAKGTDHYVLDGVSGIRLAGAPKAGVLSHHSRQADEEESRLLTEMVTRLRDLIGQPQRYAALQSSMLAHACRHFTGEGFSRQFWASVTRICKAAELRQGSGETMRTANSDPGRGGFLPDGQWQRLFTSEPQPVSRLSAGGGKVTEMGGCFIASPRSEILTIHNWSPLAEYILERSPHLYFGRTIKDLGGHYMGLNLQPQQTSRARKIVRMVSASLMPYPSLYSFASRSIKGWRKISRIVRHRGQSPVPANWGGEIPDYSVIELVSELKCGLNVISCDGVFYAVSQGDGEFSRARAEAGAFRVCLTGASQKEVMRKVAAWKAETGILPVVELVEEGVSGYNLIRYGETIYAIRQDDGAFSMERIEAGSYRDLRSGSTPEEVKASISGSLS